MIYQGTKKYPVTEVVLHTSATTPNWARGKTAEEMRDEIRSWHVNDNGWRDIGYHRVIAPDGSIAVGRSLWEIGAHVQGHNRGTVGICLIPVNPVTFIGSVEDFYTTAQIQATRDYLRDLSRLTDITKVSGHNDYANKLCPGFKVKTKDWL